MRFTAGIVLLPLGIASGCNGSFMIGAPGLPGSGVAKEESRESTRFTQSTREA